MAMESVPISFMRVLKSHAFGSTKDEGAVKPNKALQRTRLPVGCFPWRSVRAAELGRYVAILDFQLTDNPSSSK
jgi:hypothetical protein